MARRNKSHKGIAKRFRVTAKGKIKFQKTGKRHLNAHMTGNTKRKKDQPSVHEGTVAKKYVRVLEGK